MNIIKQSGVSWEDVTDFERSYRVDLPSDYEEFLVKYNGGESLDTEFHIKRVEADVDHFFGIVNVKYSVHNEDLPEWLERGVLPIAEDSFGNYIVMDVKKDPGAVYFADHEEEFSFTPLTATFKDFIKRCHSEDVNLSGVTRSIADREAALIARGRGFVITDSLRRTWQAEIDKYTGVVLEKVKLS